jgi:ParB family transcriptional regulator, chromosome partitioning protein
LEDVEEAAAMTTMKITDIRIGTRFRKELRNIDSLAASIAAIGLITPISIDENGVLLAGARRLAACKLLGLEKVEVRIMRQKK